MDSTERVTRALSFQPPDRVPLIDSFWPEFVDLWRREKGRDVIRRERGDGDLSRGEQDIGEEDVASYYGVDIRILAADESPWPSRAAELERRDGYTVRRDGWGKTIGESDNGLFYDEIDMPLKGKVDLDRLDFEPVSLASRYATCDARPMLGSRVCDRLRTRRASSPRSAGPISERGRISGASSSS